MKEELPAEMEVFLDWLADNHPEHPLVEDRYFVHDMYNTRMMKRDLWYEIQETYMYMNKDQSLINLALHSVGVCQPREGRHYYHYDECECYWEGFEVDPEDDNSVYAFAWYEQLHNEAFHSKYCYWMDVDTSCRYKVCASM